MAYEIITEEYTNVHEVSCLTKDIQNEIDHNPTFIPIKQESIMYKTGFTLCFHGLLMVYMDSCIRSYSYHVEQRGVAKRNDSSS